MGSPVGPVLVNYIILVLNNYDANSQMASGTVIYIMSVLKTEWITLMWTFNLLMKQKLSANYYF